MRKSLEDVRILGLVGSRRPLSFNQAMMNAAMELVPRGMTVELFEPLEELPYFDEYLEDRGDPDTVVRLKAALNLADGVLIASPEYNSGAPAVLKNAIDWMSRGASPLKDGLPVALMSASPGALGGIRAQLQLRQSLTGLGALVLPAPDIVVCNAPRFFDGEHRLNDEATRAFIARNLVRLGHLARISREFREVASVRRLTESQAI